ncbi:MAG: MerR family transcriptional regulator [bacterium]|nr:MerR family transcriptional regulator [bacterium]
MNKKISKLYYSIREVSEITGIPPHILRYWEQEFHCLKPKRSSSKVRRYQEKDIHVLNLVKDLLYVQKFTIAGAKKKLIEMGLIGRKSLTTKEISLKQNSFNEAVGQLTQNSSLELNRIKNNTIDILIEIKEDLKQLLQLL